MSTLSAGSNTLLRMLTIIYFIVILFCLGASFLNKVSRQNLLYIYFLLVVTIEIGAFFRIVPRDIYNSSPLFYILFFIFYFGNQKNSNKKVIYFLGFFAFISCIFFYVYEGLKEYSTYAGTSMSIIYIIYSLLWFIYQLLHVDSISIVKKQAFWVSCSLLIWAVFFIFRSIPMHWLNMHDYDFLVQINFGFQIITIFSYLIFLRGLFCKI